MKVTSSVCDVCSEPAVMTRTVQGKILDLCSIQCAFVYLQRDLERQEQQERGRQQQEKQA